MKSRKSIIISRNELPLYSESSNQTVLLKNKQIKQIPFYQQTPLMPDSGRTSSILSFRYKKSAKLSSCSQLGLISVKRLSSTIPRQIPINIKLSNMEQHKQSLQVRYRRFSQSKLNIIKATQLINLKQLKSSQINRRELLQKRQGQPSLKPKFKVQLMNNYIKKYQKFNPFENKLMQSDFLE